MNSVMPITYDFTTEELEEKLNECNLAYTSAKAKFDEAVKAKELKHQDLADTTQKYENIVKKVESKTKEIVDIDEKIVEEQSKYHDMNQQISRLTKKSAQLNEDIEKYEERIADLSKKLPKVRSHTRHLSPALLLDLSFRNPKHRSQQTVLFVRSSSNSMESIIFSKRMKTRK